MGISIRRSKDLGSGSFTLPSGIINPFAGITAPAGWLLCGGQEVLITSFTDLYAVIATTYGALTNGSGGAGSTHFRVPDLRGRVIAGEDDMGGTAASRLTNAVSGVDGVTLGAVGGNQIMHTHSHVNSLTNNAVTSGTGSAHTHIQNAHGHIVSANSFAGDRQIAIGPIGADGDKYSFSDSGNDASTTTANIYARDNTATNQNESAHTHSVTSNVTITNANYPPTAGGSSQNVQPTIILNYIIKV